MNFETPWAILGWISVLMIAVCVLAFLFWYFKALVGQLHTNWRRKRAHRGKVKCEGIENIMGATVHCPLTATRVTPNGYFCEEHWSENSIKMMDGMLGTVSWGHKLNHVYLGPH